MQKKLYRPQEVIEGLVKDMLDIDATNNKLK
jgi:hypothetical protein